MDGFEQYLAGLKASNPDVHAKIVYGLNDENIFKFINQIQNGAVGIFYCATSYAMGVDSYNTAGVERIFEIKKREKSKPLSILASRKNYINWVDVPKRSLESFEAVIEKYWPGPVSLIAPKKSIIPDEITMGMKSVHLVCIDEATEKISDCSKNPIAVTSANYSGGDLITAPIETIDIFKDEVDCFLVGGESEYKYSTTIIDFSEMIPKVIRKSSENILHELKDIIPELQW